MITFINTKERKVFSKSVQDISISSSELKKWEAHGWFAVFTVATSKIALVSGWVMLYAAERKKLEKKIGI